MSIEKRLEKLEQESAPPTDAAVIAQLKPSEILQHARELIQGGQVPTAEQRAALDSIGLATHEQP